jgi:hypothetical protein
MRNVDRTAPPVGGAAGGAQVPAVDRVLVCLYVALAALPFVAMKLHAGDHAIAGRLPPAPYPQRSFAALKNETFQRAYTDWFESKLGFKGYAIATDNSILFHLFHETKPGSAVKLGDDGVLFNDEDTAYYNKNGAWLPAPPRVDQLATKIAALQSQLRARGRALVPVLTPTKTTVYRDKIADQWRRPLGEPRPSELTIYEAFRRALIAKHVEFVDARAMLLSGQLARDDVWRPYARHWSDYGACVVMKAVAARYAALTDRAPLPYDCTLARQEQPLTHDDFDLWRLLNIWSPPEPDRVEPVAIHSDHSPVAAPPNLLVIGTSFCWNLMRDAGKARVFGTVHMDYYDKTLVPWPDGAWSQVQPGTPEWRRVFLGADLYVFDLFEGYLLSPDDTYVDTFLSAMMASSSSPSE